MPTLGRRRTEPGEVMERWQGKKQERKVSWLWGCGDGKRVGSGFGPLGEGD